MQPFKGDLKTALQRGLAKGPAVAIDACRVQAPAIAASLSRNGVRIGRTSHRLRNPANAPPAWVAPLLESYLGAAGAGAPRAVAVAPGRGGYVEPIYVQTKCLLCHGPDVAASVAAQLQWLYPDDRATGFQAGDFRGLFWVEFPTDRRQSQE